MVATGVDFDQPYMTPTRCHGRVVSLLLGNVAEQLAVNRFCSGCELKNLLVRY